MDGHLYNCFLRLICLSYW